MSEIESEVQEAQNEVKELEAEAVNVEAEAPESTEETEDEGEFDLVLSGDEEAPEEVKPENPTPEQAILFKLTKEKKKRKERDAKLEERDAEVEKLRAELDSIKSSLTGSQPVATPPQAQPLQNGLVFPDPYDPKFGGDQQKYTQAVNAYLHTLKQQEQQGQNKQNQAEEQQRLYREQVERQSTALAKRMGKFANDHKIDITKAGDALATVTNKIDEVAGIESAGLYMLDKVGDGSERVAFYFAKNPDKFDVFLNKLKNDSTDGIDSAIYLTRLADRLEPTKRTVKRSLEPDEPVKGDGTSQNKASWQKRFDDAKTTSEALSVRRQARAEGVTLN